MPGADQAHDGCQGPAFPNGFAAADATGQARSPEAGQQPVPAPVGCPSRCEQIPISDERYFSLTVKSGNAWIARSTSSLTASELSRDHSSESGWGQGQPSHWEHRLSLVAQRLSAGGDTGRIGEGHRQYEVTAPRGGRRPRTRRRRSQLERPPARVGPQVLELFVMVDP